MKVIREFHKIDKTTRVVYGELAVKHYKPLLCGLLEWAGMIPPVSEAIPVAVSNTQGRWTRSFGGNFMVSQWKHSNNPRYDEESFGPVSFGQEYVETAVNNKLQAKLVHRYSRLFGVIPFPVSLAKAHCSMIPNDAENGWALQVNVHILNSKFVEYTGNLTSISSTDPRAVALLHNVVLFDGVCNLCNSSVDFIIQRDHGHHTLFKYASQQSPIAQTLLATHAEQLTAQPVSARSATTSSLDGPNVQHMPADHKTQDPSTPSAAPAHHQNNDSDVPDDSDSLIVITTTGQVLERSDAVLSIASGLGLPWSGLALAGYLIPRFVRDSVYNWIGRNRYKFFGKKDTCRLPTLEERSRFLD